MNFTDKGLERLRCEDATAGVFVSASSQELGEISPGEASALESITSVMGFVAGIFLVGSSESALASCLLAILLVWGCYDEDSCDLRSSIYDEKRVIDIKSDIFVTITT
jgi:hypothetical protein